MPPDLAFHAKNIALLIPWRRHTSAVFAPLSYSPRIAMICSSANLDFFMPGPPVRTDPSIRWTSYSGSQHEWKSSRCKVSSIRRLAQSLRSTV